MGKVICSYGVKILFLLCISFVAYEAFMDGADGKADKLVMGLVITLSLAVLLLTRFWVRRHLQFFEKHFVKILAGYLLVLFVVQILCGIHLRYEPMWDLDSVYGGAISWLKYGNIDSYKDYFYYFPDRKQAPFSLQGCLYFSGLILGCCICFWAMGWIILLQL